MLVYCDVDCSVVCWIVSFGYDVKCLESVGCVGGKYFCRRNSGIGRWLGVGCVVVVGE